MSATTNNKSHSLCPCCKVGSLAADVDQFCVERGDKIMLIGNVPAMVCPSCLHKEFDKTVSDKLTMETHALFAKSSGLMFCYQFSDFIRTDKAENPFELFDHVRIRDDVDTWDLYDEQLLPGMEGTVIEKGMNPFDYVVRFRIGKSSERFNLLEVEIDEQDLELVARLTEGAAPKKTKRRVVKVP